MRRALEQAGYQVRTAGGAQACRHLLREGPADCLLLDIGLPDLDGLSLAAEFTDTPDLGLIIVSRRDAPEDRIAALELGCDDYITKPFSTRELVSRIRAVLRRSSALGAEKAIDVEGLKLDPVSHRITAHDAAVEMGPTEYRLLAFFMSHQERAYTRAQMLDQVWGGNVYVEDRTIDVHIRRLRKALEPHGFDRFIQTVRGTGYRFSVKPDPGRTAAP